MFELVLKVLCLNTVKISKDANLAASLLSSLSKLTTFLYLSAVAENKNNNNVVILLGKMHLQSYFLLKLIVSFQAKIISPVSAISYVIGSIFSTSIILEDPLVP